MAPTSPHPDAAAFQQLTDDLRRVYGHAAHRLQVHEDTGRGPHKPGTRITVTDTRGELLSPDLDAPDLFTLVDTARELLGTGEWILTAQRAERRIPDPRR